MPRWQPGRAEPAPRDARRSSRSVEPNRAERSDIAVRDALRTVRIPTEPNARRLPPLGASDAQLSGDRARVGSTGRACGAPHPATPAPGRGELGLCGGGGRATTDSDGIRARGATPRG